MTSGHGEKIQIAKDSVVNSEKKAKALAGSH